MKKTVRAWAVIYKPNTLSMNHLYWKKQGALNEIKSRGCGRISSCEITYELPPHSQYETLTP